MNGLSSRSSRAERRRARHSSGSDLECSDDQEKMESADDSDQSRQPRKTTVAAVSKMKLIDASEEEDTSEHKARSRTSKRAAVIQSSSESEEHDQQGRSSCMIGSPFTLRLNGIWQRYYLETDLYFPNKVFSDGLGVVAVLNVINIDGVLQRCHADIFENLVFIPSFAKIFPST